MPGQAIIACLAAVGLGSILGLVGVSYIPRAFDGFYVDFLFRTAYVLVVIISTGIVALGVAYIVVIDRSGTKRHEDSESEMQERIEV